MGIQLEIELLTREAFAPYGDVIACDEAARHFAINEGTTERFHDLARVDVADGKGRALINIFRAQPRQLPMTLTMMERHPLSSQAFFPLSKRPYLVVVAPPGEGIETNELKAFLVEGGVGVNYARGVWHYPLLALDKVSDFLVVDRGGPGENCDLFDLKEPAVLDLL